MFGKIVRAKTVCSEKSRWYLKNIILSKKKFMFEKPLCSKKMCLPLIIRKNGRARDRIAAESKQTWPPGHIACRMNPKAAALWTHLFFIFFYSWIHIKRHFQTGRSKFFNKYNYMKSVL